MFVEWLIEACRPAARWLGIRQADAVGFLILYLMLIGSVFFFTPLLMESGFEAAWPHYLAGFGFWVQAILISDGWWQHADKA